MTNDLEPSKAPSSRSAQMLSVDFGSADLKSAWVAWCAERDLVPGRRLRELAERELTGASSTPATPHPDRSTALKTASVRPRADEGKKISTKVYLTPSEHAAVAATADREGFGFPDWIIRAVRAQLTGEAAYGQSELEALRESSAQLAEVVLEIGTWRRQEPDGKVVERLAGLEAEVRAHMERVSGLMARGVRRWQIKA